MRASHASLLSQLSWFLVRCRASWLTGSLSQAGEVSWNKDLKQAAKQASEQNKPLMVMVSAKWCGYCQKMLQTTFRDEKLIEHINGCFIPVYLDADQNQELVEQLQIEGLPTTLIISPELKVVKRLPGYQSAGRIRRGNRQSLRRTPSPPNRRRHFP